MFGRKKGLAARNRTHDLFVVCIHAIIFAILFGAALNVAFIVETWFAPVFAEFLGSATDFFGFIIALGIGACIGYGSYGLFIRSERAIRAILKSDEHSGMKGARIIALVLLNVGFIGIGVAGLLYRLQFVHTSGVQYLIIIGVILECSIPLFGLVLHPIQHPPAEVLEEERVEGFATTHVGKMYDTFDGLPINQQHRVYSAIINDKPDEIHSVLDEEIARSTTPPAQKLQPQESTPPRKKRFLTVPWTKQAQPSANYADADNSSKKVTPLTTPGNSQGRSGMNGH